MAKALDDMTIDGGEVLRSIKITVRMPRLIGARIWIGSKIMLFGAWVTGMTVSFEIDDE